MLGWMITISKFDAENRNGSGLMTTLIIVKAERLRRFVCKLPTAKQK